MLANRIKITNKLEGNKNAPLLVGGESKQIEMKLGAIYMANDQAISMTSFEIITANLLNYQNKQTLNFSNQISQDLPAQEFLIEINKRICD